MCACETAPTTITVFRFKGTDWIGYDDKCSLEHKAEFLKEKNLAGGMVWELGLDDVQGNCGMGKYPLLKAIGDQVRLSAKVEAKIGSGGCDGVKLEVVVVHV